MYTKHPVDTAGTITSAITARVGATQEEMDKARDFLSMNRKRRRAIIADAKRKMRKAGAKR